MEWKWYHNHSGTVLCQVRIMIISWWGNFCGISRRSKTVNVETDQNGEPHSNPSLVMACYIQSKEQWEALQMTCEWWNWVRHPPEKLSTVLCVPYLAHIHTIALPNSCFPYVVINVQLNCQLSRPPSHMSVVITEWNVLWWCISVKFPPTNICVSPLVTKLLTHKNSLWLQ